MDATEAAVHFALALQRAGVPHAVGGAIAYGLFGAARGTHDVDLNLFVPGELAAPAVDALIGEIDGDPGVRETVPTRLVVRESTGPGR